MGEPITPAVWSQSRVRELIDHVRALGAIRQALDAFAAGSVTQPAPWHLEIPDADGEVHVKGALIRGKPHLAIKLATGFYRNPARGLASSGGFSVVLDAETGAIEAILADNGYLTDLRTGLAGAVAADALANPGVETVAVVGTGTQARHQMRSLLLVRRPQRVLVSGRRRDAADAFARELRTLHEWKVDVAPSIETAVRSADLVVTTTPARSPLVCGEWLKPGAHVTAVGADTIGKRELDASVLRRATVLAADDPDQCSRRGELQYLGADARRRIVSLGDVIADRAPGRPSVDAVTVVDLIGIGAEDAAIATLVVDSARADQ